MKTKHYKYLGEKLDLLMTSDMDRSSVIKMVEISTRPDIYHSESFTELQNLTNLICSDPDGFLRLMSDFSDDVFCRSLLVINMKENSIILERPDISCLVKRSFAILHSGAVHHDAKKSVLMILSKVWPLKHLDIMSLLNVLLSADNGVENFCFVFCNIILRLESTKGNTNSNSLEEAMSNVPEYVFLLSNSLIIYNKLKDIFMLEDPKIVDRILFLFERICFYHNECHGESERLTFDQYVMESFDMFTSLNNDMTVKFINFVNVCFVRFSHETRIILFDRIVRLCASSLDLLIAKCYIINKMSPSSNIIMQTVDEINNFMKEKWSLEETENISSLAEALFTFSHFFNSKDFYIMSRENFVSCDIHFSLLILSLLYLFVDDDDFVVLVDDDNEFWIQYFEAVVLKCNNIDVHLGMCNVISRFNNKMHGFSKHSTFFLEYLFQLIRYHLQRRDIVHSCLLALNAIFELEIFEIPYGFLSSLNQLLNNTDYDESLIVIGFGLLRDPVDSIVTEKLEYITKGKCSNPLILANFLQILLESDNYSSQALPMLLQLLSTSPNDEITVSTMLDIIKSISMNRTNYKHFLEPFIDFVFSCASNHEYAQTACTIIGSLAVTFNIHQNICDLIMQNEICPAFFKLLKTNRESIPSAVYQKLFMFAGDLFRRMSSNGARKDFISDVFDIFDGYTGPYNEFMLNGTIDIIRIIVSQDKKGDLLNDNTFVENLTDIIGKICSFVKDESVLDLVEFLIHITSNNNIYHFDLVLLAFINIVEGSNIEAYITIIKEVIVKTFSNDLDSSLLTNYTYVLFLLIRKIGVEPLMQCISPTTLLNWIQLDPTVSDNVCLILAEIYRQTRQDISNIQIAINNFPNATTDETDFEKFVYIMEESVDNGSKTFIKQFINKISSDYTLPNVFREIISGSRIINSMSLN